MLTQYVTVLQGTLAPALLIMALNVMLTVGEGRDKPLSAYWRLAGFIIGFAGAIVFAALRASAMINQRTFVNYPTLWCCVIFDIAVFVVVLFARRITTNWHDHRALLDIANAIGALAIASTTFRALPDVILRLTIFVEPGDPIFTSDMLLRALGFALGAATAIVAALIFRTMRSTAIRWSFTTAVLLLIALLFVSHFTDLAQILQSKRIVHFPTEAFLALVWCINHQRHMVIAMVLVFIIPVVASIVMGFKIKPEGANEAIVRSHIAFRRRAKAAGAWSLVAMIGKEEELDVWIPSMACGIEYDGEYYHAGRGEKDAEKDRAAANSSIRLIRLIECDHNAIECDRIYLDVHHNQKRNIERAVQYVVALLAGHPVSLDMEVDTAAIMSNYKLEKEKSSVKTLFPELAKQWDYERNGTLLPENISYGSERKVWWICPVCGGSFLKSVNTRTATRTRNLQHCPYCPTRKGEASRKPVICLETGKTYPSAEAAAAEVSRTGGAISAACRDGIKSAGFH